MVLASRTEACVTMDRPAAPLPWNQTQSPPGTETQRHHLPSSSPQDVPERTQSKEPVTGAKQSAKRPASRGTAAYPRKRANTACQVCRARKTKCDNRKPSCTFCLSVGAQCVQSQNDLSSFDPASLTILSRLDDLERILRSAPQQKGDDGSSGAQLPSPSVTSPSSRTPRLHGSRGYRNILNDDNDLGSHGRFISVLPEKVEHVLRWPLLLGPQSFKESPRKDSFDMSNPAQGSTALAELVDLEPQSVNHLLDNFFLNVHCKNPILDEGHTRRLVRKVFLEGIDWSPASCLAMIICALSCIAGPFGPNSESQIGTRPHRDSQVFFHAAQKRMGGLLASSDIVGVQCFFLSGVYMMYMMRPMCAWRFFSQALSACQQFPFITKAQNLSYGQWSPVETMEMDDSDTQEQAVYWSAWKSERELRQELSLPDFDIAHAGKTLYPPFFPKPPQPVHNADGLDQHAQRARESWLFYLSEISLRRLNSRLCSEIIGLRERYTSNSQFLEVLVEMTPEYEAQARDWSEGLPSELSIRPAAEDDDICLSVLRCHLIDLFELIYWPFVLAALEAASTEGTSMTAKANEVARRGLDMHVKRVHANQPGFFHRHHGAWLMMRSCTRSALVLVAAAKCKLAMPDQWRDAVHSVIGMLRYWSSEVPELALWESTLKQELS